ncbi:MAG: phage tape measure protein [Lachnospiraceae bacterium]|jgi:tape measure domain-containing protein|nr:phage tape measure protein [Lachnospiraceae bacterium]
MSTLKATFILNDGYSSRIDKINKRTDNAAKKILQASGTADRFNSKLNATGATASGAASKIDKAGRATQNLNNKLASTGPISSTASSGLGKFISMAAMVAGAIKGADITDNYTNTNARLKLINDGLQTQEELQNKIFAAADRSKGAYTDIAGAISKMGLLAGDTFGSNDELIGFTELLQKSFKVSGASNTEQSSALLQLTQAMAAGKLQGDEFRSIMENAPMLADAIAKFTGKSKGELKEMSAEGTITADIIKKALFAASDDINAKFAEMPMTFGNVWNKIKNGGIRAFESLMKRVNKIINSDGFEDFTDDIIKGLNLTAKFAGIALNGMERIYKFMNSNWETITNLILAGAAAWGVYRTALIGVTAVQWIAALTNPVTLAITLVALLAAAFVLLWEKSAAFRDFWVESWLTNARVIMEAYNFIAEAFNNFRDNWNLLIDTIYLGVYALETGMKAAVFITAAGVKGIIKLLSNWIDTIGIAVKAYNAVASLTGGKTIDFEVTATDVNKAIDTAAGDAASKISGAFSGVKSTIAGAKIDKTINPLDVDKVMSGMDAIGAKVKDFTVSGWLKDAFGESKKTLEDVLGDDSNTFTVEGTGADGKLKVDMADEDLRYLRDIAERDYINKMSNTTLAPNVQITFGDIHETADVYEVENELRRIIREQIAVSAEG